jgi:hypothetical protein
MRKRGLDPNMAPQQLKTRKQRRGMSGWGQKMGEKKGRAVQTDGQEREAKKGRAVQTDGQERGEKNGRAVQTDAASLSLSHAGIQCSPILKYFPILMEV